MKRRRKPIKAVLVAKATPTITWINKPLSINHLNDLYERAE